MLVVDGGGSLRCALLGDNLALTASKQGWSGIIVHGCVRDVDVLAEIDLGVQALAAHPMKSIKRNTGSRDEVLAFGGVDFVPGHHLYADNNGVILSEQPLG